MQLKKMFSLKDCKIQNKLILIIAALFSMIIGLAIFSLTSINNIRTAMNNRTLIQKIDKYASDIIIHQKEYLDDLSDYHLSQYTTNISNLTVSFKELKKFYLEESDINFVLQLIEAHMEGFFVIADSVQDQIAKNNSPEAREKIISGAKKSLSEKHQEFYETLSRLNKRIMDSIDLYIKRIENSIKLIFIIIGVIIVISTLLIVRGANKMIVEPIITLSEGMKKFGAGDVNISIDFGSEDEIGMLAKSFNDMVISVKEKIAMQKFVSSSTIEMIKSHVGGENKDRKERDVTKKKDIIIFFSDIRGFTSLSEKLDPKAIIEILNLYLDVQTNIIHEFGGYVDKFVGDEVVAIFENNKMHDKVLEAAITIQKKLIEINEERLSKGMVAVHVGMGLNSGGVVFGSIGSQDRMDYTIIGDNVNVTSRLCDIAKKEEIIMSKYFYEKLKNKNNIEKLQEINVKGKEKPLEIFKVIY